MFARTVRMVPVGPSEVARNPYGILFYKWDCPCREIEALWVSVRPTEITLSCKISHTHFSRTTYHKRKFTSLALKRRIVRDAIHEVTLFLAGRIAVTILLGADGTEHSQGWCRTEQLDSSLAYSRKVFGPGITQQAWSWNGRHPQID
jgi:hypothetical protein